MTPSQKCDIYYSALLFFLFGSFDWFSCNTSFLQEVQDVRFWASSVQKLWPKSEGDKETGRGSILHCWPGSFDWGVFLLYVIFLSGRQNVSSTICSWTIYYSSHIAILILKIINKLWVLPHCSYQRQFKVDNLINGELTLLYKFWRYSLLIWWI